MRATLAQIAKYFGYDNLAQFRKEWVELSQKDKDDLAVGIGDGSFNY